MKEIQISNDLEEVKEMLQDWDSLSIPEFCKKYNYNRDEALDILKCLISDFVILQEEQESSEGVDDWKEEYAQAYNFI